MSRKAAKLAKKKSIYEFHAYKKNYGFLCVLGVLARGIRSRKAAKIAKKQGVNRFKEL
jgi:rhodanese-related sulfurtransferase